MLFLKTSSYRWSLERTSHYFEKETENLYLSTAFELGRICNYLLSVGNILIFTSALFISMLNFWLVLLPLVKGRLDRIWNIQYWSLSFPTIHVRLKKIVLQCSFAEVAVNCKAFVVCYLKDLIFFWNPAPQKGSSRDISLFGCSTRSLFLIIIFTICFL